MKLWKCLRGFIDVYKETYGGEDMSEWISVDEYNKLFYTAECDCSEDGCNGWKSVSYEKYKQGLERSILRYNAPMPSESDFIRRL